MKRDAPYHEALGEFILEFAKAENAIFYVCYHMTKRPFFEPQALVVGMTLNLVMQKMRLLAEAQHRNERYKKNLANVLDQMRDIAQFRNMILHQGGSIDERGFTTVNVLKARTAHAITMQSIGLRELKNASLDCARIWVHCVRIRNRRDDILKFPGVKKWLRAPWLYKFRVPANVNSPPGRPARKRTSSRLSPNRRNT